MKPKTKYKRSDSGLWLSQGDAFQWLERLKSDTVDLVISDPPYESLEKHRKVGTTTRLKKSTASSNEWFNVIENERLYPLMKDLYRVLKPNRHCYMFCDDETSDILKEAGIQAGFYCWKRLIWNKEAIGMGYHYRAQYEFILFFEKGPKPWVKGKPWTGKRQLHNKGISDILSFKRIRSKTAYPTEKPVDLLEVLVTQSSDEEELVIDPFMGSGNVGLASLRNNRYFWGNDAADASLEHTTSSLAEYMTLNP